MVTGIRQGHVTHVYHWKHGWVPLDAYARALKEHRDAQIEAQRTLPDPVPYNVLDGSHPSRRRGDPSEKRAAAAWRERQDKLPSPRIKDNLRAHEVRFYERIADKGVHFRLIDRDTVNWESTSDFEWLDRDCVATEVKSTKAEYETIKKEIQRAVERARVNHRVKKEVFVIDLTGRKIDAKLVNQLAKYNIRNPDNAIKELWIEHEGDLHRVPLHEAD